MIKIRQSSNERGGAFEETVARLLTVLHSAHPTRVAVKRKPQLVLYNDEVVIPDFEVACSLPHQRDIRLIECQDRNKSSQGIQRKFRQMKSLSKHNRCLLVYRDPEYLSSAVKTTLKKDGVPTYDLLEFVDYLRRLDLVISRSEEIPAGRVQVQQAMDLLKVESPSTEKPENLVGVERQVTFFLGLLQQLDSATALDSLGAARLENLASNEGGKDEAMVAVARPDWKPSWSGR